MDDLMERPPPISPARRIQTDGTVAIEYLNQVRQLLRLDCAIPRLGCTCAISHYPTVHFSPRFAMVQASDGGASGAVSSPPGSPSRAQAFSGGGYAPAPAPGATLSAPVPALGYAAHSSDHLRQPQQSAPPALAGAQARVRSARTSGSGAVAAAPGSGIAAGANSVQVLLSRLPGAKARPHQQWHDTGKGVAPAQTNAGTPPCMRRMQAAIGPSVRSLARSRAPFLRPGERAVARSNSSSRRRGRRVRMRTWAAACTKRR